MSCGDDDHHHLIIIILIVIVMIIIVRRRYLKPAPPGAPSGHDGSPAVITHTRMVREA
jgi:hypothetical protein